VASAAAQPPRFISPRLFLPTDCPERQSRNQTPSPPSMEEKGRGEGDSNRFMAPTHVQSLEVFAAHEPAGVRPSRAQQRSKRARLWDISARPDFRTFLRPRTGPSTGALRFQGAMRDIGSERFLLDPLPTPASWERKEKTALRHIVAARDDPSYTGTDFTDSTSSHPRHPRFNECRKQKRFTCPAFPIHCRQ